MCRGVQEVKKRVSDPLKLKPNSSSLTGQQVLLTAEPLLHSYLTFFFLFKTGVAFLPNSYPAEKNCLIHFLFSK